MILRPTHLIALVLSASAAAAHAQEGVVAPRRSWTETFEERLPALGHRNWIAIVDAAYPLQTSPGIEVVLTQGAGHLNVVGDVLQRLASARHVRPVVYLDAELDYVAETDAPGIEEYRNRLAKLAPRDVVNRLPHAEIIDRLDAAGRTFRILVLKTNMKLPYTSVFIELDCGYWSPAAEERLRAAMQQAAP